MHRAAAHLGQTNRGDLNHLAQVFRDHHVPDRDDGEAFGNLGDSEDPMEPGQAS